MSLYKCTKGIVITNNVFQPSAIQLARATGVELLPRITPGDMAGIIARSGVKPCVDVGDSINYRQYRKHRTHYPRMELDKLILTKHLYWIRGNIHSDYIKRPINEVTYRNWCTIFNAFFWVLGSILWILIAGAASRNEIENMGQALAFLGMFYFLIFLIIAKWVLNRPIRRLKIARKRKLIK